MDKAEVLVMAAASEAFGFEGNLQTVNSSDLLRFAELLKESWNDSAPSVSVDEPDIHSYDPSPARMSVTVRWPDGRCLLYSLDTTCYTDTPEVQAAIQRAEASKAQPAPVAEHVQFQSNVCEWSKSGIADTYTSTCGRTLRSRQLGRLCQYCGIPVRYKIEGQP